MMGRIQRARPLRRRVMELHTTGSAREKSIEMSASLTIACVVLLLSIGASIVTSYIMIHNPDCMGNPSLRSSSSTIITTATTTAATTTAHSDTGNRPATLPVADSTAKTVAATPPEPAPAPVDKKPIPPSPVPQCTADEMTKLKKQLPKEGCDKPAWSQACSFTIATAKSGCHDTTVYFRQPLASMSLKDPFRAVIVGTKEDEIIVDLLQLATHDTEKYSLDKWGKIVGIKNCLPPPVAYTGKAKQQTAKVMVIEPDTTRAMKVKRWKTEMGLTNDDLRGETTRITDNPPGEGAKSLNSWAQTELPTGPIHFLRLDSEADYEVLLSGAGEGGALERVWYVEFQYHWQARWKDQELNVLIDDTLRDFACYWKGGSGTLFRITGCWQDHYAKHSWSYISCVNVRIDGAKPIADKMEEVFRNTLAKDKVFAAE